MLVNGTDPIPYEWIRIRAIPGTPDVQLRCTHCANLQTIDTISTRADLGRVAHDFILVHKHCKPRVVH